jgi:hypothetical protein
MRLTPDEKIVLVLDTCFSSSIVEFLHRKRRIGLWESIQGWMKNYVWRYFGKDYCYKFIGDGWIVLLPTDFGPAAILRKLKTLSDGFKYKYEESIRPEYARTSESQPPYYGLTFGVDSGVLLRTRMMNRREYLGPALNIAARLQGTAKDLEERDAGGCLVASDSSYQTYLRDVEGYDWKSRSTLLRNICHDRKLQVWTCRL